MKDTILSMLTIQDELNRLTIGPCWREQHLDWTLAIFVECAEGIEHLAWKWWKKQEVNLKAAQLEVIDIHHFVLSNLLHVMPFGTLEGIADEEHESSYMHRVAPMHFHGDKYEIDALEPIALFKLIGAQAGANYADLGLIFALGEKLGMTPQEQYKLYCAKAVLNTFRQKNGYKEGTYKKIWKAEEGVMADQVHHYEDNDFLQSIIGAIDFSKSNAPEELYSALQLRYEIVKVEQQGA